MARGLKFGIYVVEGLYYPYSENKGADQLRGHREADLCLCFRVCKKPVNFMISCLFCRNKKSRKRSGRHGIGGLYDMPFGDHGFAGPSSRRGGRERDGPRLHSAVDPFDFPLFK